MINWRIRSHHFVTIHCFFYPRKEANLQPDDQNLDTPSKQGRVHLLLDDVNSDTPLPKRAKGSAYVTALSKYRGGRRAGGKNSQKVTPTTVSRNPRRSSRDKTDTNLNQATAGHAILAIGSMGNRRAGSTKRTGLL